MSRFRLVLALCACALLAVPALAGARPGQHGFDATYPHASRLCAKTAAGRTPKRLRGSTSQVAAACAALRTSFTGAQNAYTTTVAPLRQDAADALKQLRATCRQARASKDVATCKQARRQTRATITGLRAQVRGAATTYHASVDGARRTFWATIRGLRGGSTITPDTTVGPGPATTLPSDAAVAAA